MALIPHEFFPRSMMDMDRWMKPFGLMNTLEAFDPFDELDNTISRNFHWLNKPDFLTPILPRVPQKYRVTLDCSGFKPSSIKTEWKGRILTITGREEDKYNGSEDFSVKEFKKTYTVPPNAECDKLVSFMTNDGMLCVEVPLKEIPSHSDRDLFPQVVDENGGKVVKMKFSLPDSVEPENIHVNIKDRCLIVKAEEKKVKPDGVSKFHYYKKTTLPENTDFDALKCNYDNGTHQMSICAPINMDFKGRNIPVQYKSPAAVKN